MDEFDIDVRSLGISTVVRDEGYRDYHRVTLGFSNAEGVGLSEVTIGVCGVERGSYKREIEQSIDILQRRFGTILDNAREMAAKLPDSEDEVEGKQA